MSMLAFLFLGFLTQEQEWRSLIFIPGGRRRKVGLQPLQIRLDEIQTWQVKSPCPCPREQEVLGRFTEGKMQDQIPVVLCLRRCGNHWGSSFNHSLSHSNILIFGSGSVALFHLSRLYPSPQVHRTIQIKGSIHIFIHYLIQIFQKLCGEAGGVYWPILR